MVAYLKELVEVDTEKNFDSSTLENESAYTTGLTEENLEEINAVMNRDWMTWTATEGSLMTKFNRVN